MNKKSFLFKSVALTSVIVLNVTLCSNLNRNAKVVNAYSTTSLPTTIDLNDCTDEQIRTYYSGLNSLDASERQGSNLLKNLKPILKNGQKYLSYDSNNGNDIWDVYCIVDRDWNKSPASALPAAAGTYNSETNKITNYHWGNNSDTYENPYLHALYYNRDKAPIATAYADHQNNTATGMNREHIWPKGAGFDTKTTSQGGTGGARGDLLHLWAAHAYTNNIHNNNFYGYVDTNKSYTDIGNSYSMCAGNLSGKSKTFPSSSNTVFEPQDSDKGDIARACFYMAARYNYLSGSDSDGIDSNNPNLELVNNVSDFQNNGYESTTTNTGKLGILQDLLEWNRLDPPDQFEIHRNNLCYNNFTGNRNPFIDFPSWADAIWGTVDEEGNYNSTPSKSVSPINDPINTSDDRTIELSTDSIDLAVGETAEISGNHANGNITWSVEDETVIELDKTTSVNEEVVTITALKGGTTTITASNSGNDATCTVTVTDEAQSGLSLASSISVGDTVYLGCDAASAQYNGPSSTATIYGLYSEYTTKPNTNNYPLEVCTGSGDNTYAFKIKEGTHADEYLTWLDGNSLSTSSTLNSNSSWTVSIDGDNNATIANAADGARVIWWNATYPRFACYTGKTAGSTYKNVQLWKEAEQEPTVNDYFAHAAKYTELLGTEGIGLRNVTNSVTFSQAGLSNAQDISNFAIGDVTLNGALGNNTNSNTPKYYTSGTAVRIYFGNTITFTCGEEISSITFTFSQGSGANLSASVGTLNENTWTGSANSITFTNTQTSGQIRISTVSVTYKKEGFMVSNVAMRFGMSIPKEDWDTIHTQWGIDDYGVMTVKEDTLTGYGVSSVKAAYQAKKALKISRKGSYSEPHSLDENNYGFTIKMNMTSEANYNIVYRAAPFIVVDDTYYFLADIRYSVNLMATYYLSHSGCELSEDALTLLSTTH